MIALVAAMLAWASAPQPAHADGLSLSGYNETRWRLRASGATDDQDLYDTISLGGRGRAAAFQVHAGLTHDLEGLSPAGSYKRFGSLTDTFGDRTHGYLYSAHLDLGGAPDQGRPLLRAGRQWRTQAETFQFDGLALRFGLGRSAELSAIGGVPVHFYESSPKGDRLRGAGLRVRPFEFIELGADYTRIVDAREGSTVLPRKNEVAEASAVLRLSDLLVLRGASSWLDGNLRKLTASGSIDLPDQGFSLTASATRQALSTDDLVTELAPAWPVLGAYKPYQSYRLAVRQELSETVVIDLEGQVRLLDRTFDESIYNHDFQRFRAGLSLAKLPAGLDLDLYAETWQAAGVAGDDARTGGFAVRRGFGSGWKASAGSEYALFKYDLINRQERQDVRTWFLRLERAAPKGWGLRASWEIEDDEDSVSNVLDLAIRRNF